MSKCHIVGNHMSRLIYFLLHAITLVYILQVKPDPEFPTVKYPNPEEGKGALVCTCSLLLIRAATCDFQQCGILTSVDSDKPVHTPFKPRNSKWYPVSCLTLLEYSSD